MERRTGPRVLWHVMGRFARALNPSRWLVGARGDSDWPLIVSMMLMGSMAIHISWLKTEHRELEQRTAVRLRTLADVLARIRRGEKVDVARELGTGSEEAEWQERKYDYGCAADTQSLKSFPGMMRRHR